MQKQVTQDLTAGVVASARLSAEGGAFGIVVALGFCHMLNDMMQSMIPALYPMFKTQHGLDFAQIGLITLAFQLTASLLQPLVGLYTDRRPMPYSLSVGMGFTLIGLVSLSMASSFATILLSAATVGIGSSVFHPESSRVARLASGGRHGLAQSLFQVGGNAGSALGPLLAAFVVVPRGQGAVAWFSLTALLAMTVLGGVGVWYSGYRRRVGSRPRRVAESHTGLSRNRVLVSLGILISLMFSKFFYMSSLSTYYTFFLIHKFAMPVQDAQVYLFVFLASAAAGTFIGGPVGDRIGPKYVIWGSILGVLPFTMALPYAGQHLTLILTIPIGLILASAFSAIIVYAQELVPGKVGMISGLFFGFAFGLGGLGAALLGELADMTSIETVYRVCAFLPLIGLLTAFLPNLHRAKVAVA